MWNVRVKYTKCEVQIGRVAVNSESIAVSLDDEMHVNSLYNR